MEPLSDMLARYDALWQTAERRLRRHLESEEDDAGLRALNTAVTVLKRIQDARRALHLDAARLEDRRHADDRQGLDDDDPERLSRVVRRLEEEGDAEGDEAPDADAL